MVSLILVFESLRYLLLCDIGSAAHDLLSFLATTLHLLPKYKVKQWLEIYSRIYGNDKSRNSANEGAQILLDCRSCAREKHGSLRRWRDSFRLCAAIRPILVRLKEGKLHGR